ncbi:MAG: hypothetical protein AAF492_09270 [Verrucomicrobiota bacterium]
MKKLSVNLVFVVVMLMLTVPFAARSEEPTLLTVDPGQRRQIFEGMGCGTIFYSGHIVSLARRNKHKLQKTFYDELFSDVSTQYLQVLIRPDFEPKNDNEDPYRADFKETAFVKNGPALEVCRQALKRKPDMKIYATLYTPPPWMKTNEDESGGGGDKATLKPGLALELGEYIWAYLRHMNKNGQPVHYLSISNEADWGHKQPGYFLSAKRHAALFEVVADYLVEMEMRFPEVPRPKLVGPNILSAVGTAKKYWPALSQRAKAYVDVLGSHDYDRRGHRWKTLRDLAGERPLWCSEWCWNGRDETPGLIKAASEFWLVMTEAFNDGANVWMAYDWAYPPREGGEALTHVEWGQWYKKTKIYYGFKQWCNALTPGMRVVQSNLEGPDATGISTPGVKASAFVDPSTSRLVVHVVNLQDKTARFAMKIRGAAYANAPVRISRTSVDDADKTYPASTMQGAVLTDSFKPREMATYVITPPAL